MDNIELRLFVMAHNLQTVKQASRKRCNVA